MFSANASYSPPDAEIEDTAPLTGGFAAAGAFAALDLELPNTMSLFFYSTNLTSYVYP